MNDQQLTANLQAIHRDPALSRDADAIYQHVMSIPIEQRSQRRSWFPRLTNGRFDSKFSATRFVVAGVTVALAGGYLLTAVRTMPSDETVPAAVSPGATASADAQTTVPTITPETTTRDDLLPGEDLVTEQVEPGVHRVLSDGLHDLLGSATLGSFTSFSDSRVIAGLDGTIWWLGPDGFFRLGEERVYTWPTDLPVNPAGVDIEVGPDGTMWTTGLSRGLLSFDGDSWTTRRKRPATANGSFGGVEVQRDGTVWVAERTETRARSWRVLRLDASGWEVLPGKIERLSGIDLSVADDGGQEVWVMAPGQRLQRHDGSRWLVQEVPESRVAPARSNNPLQAAVAPDGKVLWVRLRSGTEIARFDGHDWQVFDTADGGAFFEAGRDGSLWFNPIRPSGIGCDGVANVDGDTTRYLLKGLCVYAMDIAPDGGLWLQAGEDRRDPGDSTAGVRTVPVHAYVITPEAVTATE